MSGRTNTPLLALRSFLGTLLAMAVLELVPGVPLIAAAPQIVQPGLPGQPARPISPEEAVAHARKGAAAPDIQFIQGMISHHAQALEMTALIGARTTSSSLTALGTRIEISQRDEIGMMQDWLRSYGLDVPDPRAHVHGAALMPGMLTPEEMRQLAEARDAAFDRLFLELMIKHHTGAIQMVRTLFADPAGGLAPEIFTFATDVDADQRSEIDRMRALLVR